jgi:hypothetical protein
MMFTGTQMLATVINTHLDHNQQQQQQEQGSKGVEVSVSTLQVLIGIKLERQQGCSKDCQCLQQIKMHCQRVC